jgi:hypothetical protein
MRAIERPTARLKAPDDESLGRCLNRVRELYRQSYGWAPPPAETGMRETMKTMRHHIKAWITDWDLQRLYGTKDEIAAEPLPADYTENTDLEHASEQEAAEEQVT